MFSVVSKASVGAIILLVEQCAKMFGVTFPEGTIAGVVDAVYTLVGFGLLLYGLWDRQDLDYGIFRK
jgi:uncharacterized membrane protein